MRGIEKWLQKEAKSPEYSLVAALLIAGATGVLDYWTGPELGISVFYLIPVGIAAWYCSPHAGVLVAFFCAVIWLTADLLWAISYSIFFTPYWNAFIRLGFFLVVAVLLSALKSLTEQLEQRVAERTAQLETTVRSAQQAEQRTLVSEEQFRQLAENISEVFWMTNLDKTQMIYISPGYEGIWGRTCASLYASPKDWVEAIHPLDRERVIEAAMTKQVDGNYDEEYIVVRPDGSERWIHDRAFPVRDATGTVYRIAGIAEDITERKQAEFALLESQRITDEALAFKTRMLSTSSIGILTYDGSGQCVFANEAAAKVAGATVEAILTQNYHRIQSWKASGLYDAAMRAVDTETEQEVETHIRTSFGKEAYLNVCFSSFKVRGQIHLLAFTRDITERVRAQERIAMLARFPQENPQPVIRISKDGEVLSANPPAQPVIRAPGNDNGYLCDEWRKIVAQAYDSLERVEIERKFNDRLFSFYIVPVADKGYVNIYGRDITEQRRAEDALRSAEEKWRSLVENSRDFIYTVDRHGTVLSMSRAVEGANLADVVGRNIFDFLHKDDHTEVKNKMRTVFEQGESTLYESRGPGSHDTIAWYETRAVPIKRDGSVISAMFISSDITERKRIADALHESEVRYRRFIETSQEGFGEIDAKGRITYVNARLASMFGYEAAEMVGLGVIDDLVHPDGRSEMKQQMKARAEGKSSVYEARFVRKDGNDLCAIVSGTPIMSDDGVRTGGFAMMTDITERKRLEREILEVVDREQSRLGQELHDGLCQQLIGTAFLCNALERKLGRKAASEANQVRHIAELLDDAITEARSVARGLFPVKLQADGLASALQEYAAGIEGVFDVKCKVDCAETALVSDLGTSMHLYRIAQEAVMNAIKHGKANKITISLSDENGQVHLVVRDNGTEEWETSAEQKGMGLAIMQYRARLIGGSLEVGRQDGMTIVSCTCGPSTNGS